MKEPVGEEDAIIERSRWYAMRHGGQPYLNSGELLIKARYANQIHRERTAGYQDEWINLGPINGAGRATAIAAHPDFPDVILAGTAGGGVWKTMNGGETWSCLTDNLPDLSVGALAVAPSNPNIIYLGSGEGGYAGDFIPGIGLIKSMDGGNTWLLPNDVIAEKFYDISIDPGNPEIILCGTDVGLLRSEDGGVSWDLLFAGLDITEILRSIHDPNFLYLAAWCSGTCEDDFRRIWKSLDGGMTWTDASGGLPSPRPRLGFYERTSLAWAHSDEKILYAAFSRGSGEEYLLSRIYKTVDGGDSWSELNAVSENENDKINRYMGDQGWYDNVIIVSPSDPGVVIAGGVYYIRSQDGGLTWEEAMEETGHDQYLPHVDAHDMVFHGMDLFLACDGGIYLSHDDGLTWEDRNQGLVTRQYYALGLDSSHPRRIIAGTQDNGTDKKRDDDSGNWDIVLGGDGFECAIHSWSPEVAFATEYFGKVFRTNEFSDSSPLFVETGPKIQDSGASFYTPFEVNPFNQETVFTGSSFLWKSADGGLTWLKMPTESLNQTGWNTASVLSISVSSLDPHSLLVSKGTALYWSRDGGYTWMGFSYNAGTFPGTSLIINADLSPHDSYGAVACMSRGEGGNLFITRDGGVTWERSDAGLPPFSVQVARYDPGTPDLLYAGTDVGLYRSEDGGRSWLEAGRGLPRSSVHDLKILKDGSAMRVATHGRGVWELPLSSPPDYPPVVEIETPVSEQHIAIGENVVFSGSVSDPDGNVEKIGWFFSDSSEYVAVNTGSTSLTRRFMRSGRFPVSLTAEDSNGSVRSDSVFVNVSPPGDSCYSPVVIPTGTAFPFTISTNNVNAEVSPEDPEIPCLENQDGRAATLWFDFTPAETSDYIINTCGSTADTVLSLWTGDTCGSYAHFQSACNDDDEYLHCPNRTDSYFERQLKAGETYHILLSNFDGYSLGPVRLTIDCQYCSQSKESVIMTIPAAAFAGGIKNTLWRTDVSLLNPDDTPSQGEIQYCYRERNNTFNFTYPLMIPSTSVVQFDNIVQGLFKETSSAGAIRLFMPNSVHAVSRTYHESDQGTFGQAIPSFTPSVAASSQESVFLPFVTANADYRSNLGITNITDLPFIASIRVFSDQGDPIRAFLEEIPPRGVRQINQVVSDLNQGYIRVSTDTPNIRFHAYLSVIDNRSGDAVYVYPSVLVSEDLFIPAAAHSSGSRGTEWKTDLEVANSTYQELTYAVYYLPEGQDNSVKQGYAFILEPGQTRRHVNIIQSLFSSDSRGALQVVPHHASVMAVSRTYTTSSEGTRGQYIPGYPLSEALTCQSPAHLPGLRWSEHYRSNFGFLNASARDMALTMKVFGPEGQLLLDKDLALRPYESLQLNDPLMREGVSADYAWAEISCETPEARYFAYASVVDNRSNDPVFIPASTRP